MQNHQLMKLIYFCIQMTQYNIPDQWVILQLPDNNYKVLAIWLGSYLQGDSWKVNSGITHIIADEEYYYIYGYSGSCYKCNKLSYGITSSYGLHILNMIITQTNNEIQLIDNITEIIDKFN